LFERMYAEGDQHDGTMTRVVAALACTIGEWRFTFAVSAAMPRAAAGR
jgi:hypothetical protein